MKIKVAVVVSLLLCCTTTAIAAQGDSLQVSLITCSPGNEAYTLFGHTAIRVRDERRGSDWVYNYGMFNYRSEGFVWRFVRGETDYILGVEPADFFFGRYLEQGYSVEEQVLALDEEECGRLREELDENARPENRTYRYNFLYDNCTTRARDMLERLAPLTSLDFSEETGTFRQLLHQFTHDYPWTEFGIDLVLGAEVDRTMTQRESMFIPSVFAAFMDDACWEGQGRAVSECRHYAPVAAREETGGFALSPMAVMLCVLVLTLATCVWEWRSRRRCVLLDALLIVVQGLAGCLIAFLFFFSEHPAVDTNWLVLAFNPLAFVLLFNLRLPLNWFQKACEYVNLSVLTFTLLLFLLPLQSIPSALLPLVLSLLVRGLTRVTK